MYETILAKVESTLDRTQSDSDAQVCSTQQQISPNLCSGENKRKRNSAQENKKAHSHSLLCLGPVHTGRTR